MASVEPLDPLGWEIEVCPDGQLEVQKPCVFSIPFRSLVICLLIEGNLISKSLQLITKSFFHLMVGLFMGFDGLKESLTDSSECEGIDVIADGIEGCVDRVGQ
jgi:hypothetical protein